MPLIFLFRQWIQEFDVALIGKKGTWYDHKVKITNAEKKDEQTKVPSALGSMLTWKRSVKLHYATQFSIDYYEDPVRKTNIH